MNKPTRRDFLHAAALGGLAAIVQGCPGSKKTSDALPPDVTVYSDFAFKNKESIDYLLHLAAHYYSVDIAADTAPLGNYKLHFYELADSTQRPIALNEYFVLTNNNPPENTHVLRYTGIDTLANTLSFLDLATGARSVTYDPITNTADLIAGGNTYHILINPATGNLAIDQNADGVFGVDPGTGVLIDTEAPLIDIADNWTLEEDLYVPLPP